MSLELLQLYCAALLLLLQVVDVSEDSVQLVPDHQSQIKQIKITNDKKVKSSHFCTNDIYSLWTFTVNRSVIAEE